MHRGILFRGFCTKKKGVRFQTFQPLLTLVFLKILLYILSFSWCFRGGIESFKEILIFFCYQFCNVYSFELYSCERPFFPRSRKEVVEKTIGEKGELAKNVEERRNKGAKLGTTG